MESQRKPPIFSESQNWPLNWICPWWPPMTPTMPSKITRKRMIFTFVWEQEKIGMIPIASAMPHLSFILNPRMRCSGCLRTTLLRWKIPVVWPNPLILKFPWGSIICPTSPSRKISPVRIQMNICGPSVKRESPIATASLHRKSSSGWTTSCRSLKRWVLQGIF